MKRYSVLLVAEFEVLAENIVEAKRVASRIRALGEVSGLKRPSKHDRDAIEYSIKKQDEWVRIFKKQ